EQSESDIEPRREMPAVRLAREEFRARFLRQFVDLAFEPLRTQLDAIENVAWQAYDAGRKAPRTRKAGPEFADPDYDLSVDWLAAGPAIGAAQQPHHAPATPSRILIVNGSPRSEHTCPGETSKSWRLVKIAEQAIEGWSRDEGHTCEIEIL